MNGVLFCCGGFGWSLGDPQLEDLQLEDPLLEQRFELFGGFAVFFGLFLFLPAAGDGGEFVRALGAFVGGGAVGGVEGVAGAGHAVGGGWPGGGVGGRAGDKVDLDGVAGDEAAFEQGFAERVLDFALDDAAQGTGAVVRVVAGVGDGVAGGGREHQLHILLVELGAQGAQLKLDDFGNLFLGEAAEDHDAVETVDELGAEGLFEGVHDL